MAGYTAAPTTTDTQLPLSSVQVMGRTAPVPMQGSRHTLIDAVNNETAPVMVEESSYEWLRAGQMFVASTGRLATLTNGNLIMGASLFNPSSVRNILILSARVMQPVAVSDAHLNFTTTDPAFAQTSVPVNLSAGNLNASVLSFTFPAAAATASVALSGTLADTTMFNNVGEFLPANMGILLPAGVANGVAIFTTVITAGGFYGMSFRWVEFV